MNNSLLRIFLILYLFRLAASVVVSYICEPSFYIFEFITSSIWLAGEICLIYFVFIFLKQIPFKILSTTILFLIIVSMSMWSIADPIVVALAGDHLTPSLLAHFAGFQIFLSDELWLPIKQHAILVIFGLMGLLSVFIFTLYFSKKAIFESSKVSVTISLYTLGLGLLMLLIPWLIEGRLLIYPPEASFIRNYLKWDQIKPKKNDFDNLYRLFLDKDERLVDAKYPLEVITTEPPYPDKLNIILIVIESLRASENQIFNPNAEFQMNSFDLFGKKGVIYQHMISNGFPSVEGFSALTMGSWSHSKDRIVVSHHDKSMPSLSMALKKNGYLTYSIEDNLDLEEESYWVRKTYDRHSTYEDQGKFASTRVMFNDLKTFVEEYESTNQPFFIHLKTRNPHYPYEIANDSLKEYYTIGSPAENYFESMRVIDRNLVDLYNFFWKIIIFLKTL